MGKFEAIKNAINANIKINGRSEITGGILNGVLIGMVEEVDSVKQDVIADLEDIRRNAAEAIKDIPEEYVTDDELSQALNSKVDKESGKQLSTEDFTAELKAKLEGLSNYDDTAIQNAVNALAIEIDTLVNGDASNAIESFNEIIAFLEDVEDSENLESIIAAIEKQITAKQDTITDLDIIRANASKGATALQSVPSEYVTESELSAKGYATTSQVNEKQDKISDLETIRSGAAKGATAIQSVKTINGQSIIGEGDITIEADVDTSAFATKEELTTLQTEVINNEEVTAAAINELNERIGAAADTAYVDNAISQAITSTLNTEV